LKGTLAIQDSGPGNIAEFFYRLGCYIAFGHCVSTFG
jgi:hypothetical protein